MNELYANFMHARVLLMVFLFPYLLHNPKCMNFNSVVKRESEMETAQIETAMMIINLWHANFLFLDYENFPLFNFTV